MISLSAILFKQPAIVASGKNNPVMTAPTKSNLELVIEFIGVASVITATIIVLALLVYDFSTRWGNPLVFMWNHTGGYLISLYINSTNDGKLNFWGIPLWNMAFLVLPRSLPRIFSVLLRIWSSLFVVSERPEYSK